MSHRPSANLLLRHLTKTKSPVCSKIILKSLSDINEDIIIALLLSCDIFTIL